MTPANIVRKAAENIHHPDLNGCHFSCVALWMAARNDGLDKGQAEAMEAKYQIYALSLGRPAFWDSDKPFTEERRQFLNQYADYLEAQ